MSGTTLEERVTRLEEVLNLALAPVPALRSKRKDWRRTIGMFDGDAVMGEIIDGALRMREEERRQVEAQDQKENA